MPADAAVVDEPVVLSDEEKAAQEAEAAADAEFDAGFTDVKPTAEEPPAKTDEELAAEKAAKEAADKAAAAAAAVVPEYVQVTKSDWTALQAKAAEIDAVKADSTKKLDTAFGKLGGIERKLKEMQEATPAGQAVELTDEDTAELTAEFPELGKLLHKTLKGITGKLKGTAAPAVDTKELETRLASTAVSTAVALQIEALEEDYPDWRTTVGEQGADNPYRKWLATQDAAYQQKLAATNSAAVIGRSLKKFTDAQTADATAKATTDAAAKKAADEKAAADKVAATRKERFEAAATSKGAGGHTPGTTEDDEFEAGFKGK